MPAGIEDNEWKKKNSQSKNNNVPLVPDSGFGGFNPNKILKWSFGVVGYRPGSVAFFIWIPAPVGWF